jgi:hypothetical protein
MNAEQFVIVWDLETIPDLEAARRMLGLPNATDTEVRDAMGWTFPKHPVHKIVCIGALIARRQPEGWSVEALKTVFAFQPLQSPLADNLPPFIGHPKYVTLPTLVYTANELPAFAIDFCHLSVIPNPAATRKLTRRN